MIKIFHFLLNVLEFSYKKKILKNLKENLPNKMNSFIDIAAHHGQTTIQMHKNFSIENFFLFEPSIKNFHELKKQLNKKKIEKNLKIFNYALGNENKDVDINEVLESSSSTINSINTNTNYFRRKKKILSLFSRKIEITKDKIKLVSFSNFIKKNNIQKIDFIKIDTEGYEFNILKNIENFLENVGVIQFEHHYDLMIVKNYRFRDIHNLLINNNFQKKFKSKMKFRKSFEYIYKNKNYRFD
jgi:FkbM family methyltransferase